MQHRKRLILLFPPHRLILLCFLRGSLVLCLFYILFQRHILRRSVFFKIHTLHLTCVF